MSLSEAVKGRMEFRGAVRRRAEGIELDVEVTVVANSLRQRGRADHSRDIVDRSRWRRGGHWGAPDRGRAAASASTSAGSTRSNVALVSGSTLLGSCR